MASSIKPSRPWESLNPGTAGGVRSRPGYAVVTVREGTYRAELR